MSKRYHDDLFRRFYDEQRNFVREASMRNFAALICAGADTKAMEKLAGDAITGAVVLSTSLREFDEHLMREVEKGDVADG